MSSCHLTASGHRLALSVYGPESGRPVLLFHGGGQTRHAWTRTAAALGALGYRAIAADLRGHGDSDWPGNYRIHAFAEDVQSLVQAQREKPVIVGASLGGLSALVANAGREISCALVLVDIAPRLNPAGVDRILGFMAAHAGGFASLDEAAAAVSHYQPQRTQKNDSSGLQKNLRQRDDGRWYWHWDPAMLTTFQHNELPENQLYDIAEKLTQPVLLVRGSMSDVINEDITREFQERMPQARVANVSGAGHMVAGDRNDVFLDAVTEFLGSLPG
ncbi:MAG: alpha/beta hydrolase [bacterium]|nr:alpha/beta hydrolase [bacterium]